VLIYSYSTYNKLCSYGFGKLTEMKGLSSNLVKNLPWISLISAWWRPWLPSILSSKRLWLPWRWRQRPLRWRPRRCAATRGAATIKSVWKRRPWWRPGFWNRLFFAGTTPVLLPFRRLWRMLLLWWPTHPWTVSSAAVMVMRVVSGGRCGGPILVLDCLKQEW